MIYLDNAATTKPSNGAIEAYNNAIVNFFNPSANYTEAIKVGININSVRQQILNKLHAEKNYNIIFTSGASEANNTAINYAKKYKTKTMLVSLGEHASVYEAIKQSGINYKTINLKKDGTVDDAHLIELLNNNDVSLVAIMHVNNETGAINNIPRLCEIVKSFNNNILFLCDGVQGFLKFNVNLQFFNVDFYTISAHKVGGFKGIGALIFKNNLNLKPLIFGGGQEFGLRSGTENVAGILSFKEAINDFIVDNEKIKLLKKTFISNISKLNNIQINAVEGSDYIVNVSAKDVRSEVVVTKLGEKGVLASSGSACHSRHQDNRVLSAMGIPNDYLLGTNRFSFSLQNTIEEVELAAQIYVSVINELRG